jgi:hypothetical protein
MEKSLTEVLKAFQCSRHVNSLFCPFTKRSGLGVRVRRKRSEWSFSAPAYRASVHHTDLTTWIFRLRLFKFKVAARLQRSTTSMWNSRNGRPPLRERKWRPTWRRFSTTLDECFQAASRTGSDRYIPIAIRAPRNHT